MSEFPLLPVRLLHSEPALGKVRALAASDNGSLWAGTDSGVVVEFAYEGLAVRRFHAHKGGVTCLVAAKGKLMSGGNDGCVRIWCHKTLSRLSQLEACGRRVSWLICNEEDSTVWAGTSNGKAVAWRMDGTPFLHDNELPPPRPPIPADIKTPSAHQDAEGLTWVAGRGAQRAGLLARVPHADPTQTKRWRLPYTAACLVFWRDERTLYAGGNGRVFAIDLPCV